MAELVVVDDSDPAIIYHGKDQWFSSGVISEFRKTTHGTYRAGASATFHFTGSSIAVYGTIGNETEGQSEPVSTYALDELSPTKYVPIRGPKIQYRRKMYQSPELSDGKHTLVITLTSENTYFWLDYLEYLPPLPSPTPAAIITVSPSSSTMQGSTLVFETTLRTSQSSSTMQVSTSVFETTLRTSLNRTTAVSSGGAIAATSDIQATTSLQIRTSLVFQLPTGSSATGRTSRSGPPTGVIVGVVIGGVVFLLIIILLFLLWRRRPRNGFMVNRATSHTGVYPFTAMGTSVITGMAFNKQPKNFGQLSSISYGHPIQGGTSSEKVGFDRQHPSARANSQMNASSGNISSPQSVVFSPGSGSPKPPTEHDKVALPPPVQNGVTALVAAQFSMNRASGTLPHHEYPDDEPPAYRQSTPTMHQLF